MVYTSYVGSFPLDFSKENVERILHDVIKLGIDYPCYPQLRSFIDMFLDPLVEAKVLKRVENAYVIDYPFYTLNLDNIAEQLEIPEFTWSIDFLASTGLSSKVKGFRACVTGPYTLASQVYIKPPYTLSNSGLSSRAVVDKLTSFVSIVAEKFSKKASIVSIDEPILSVVVEDKGVQQGLSEEGIRSSLERVFKSIRSMPSIHVCGYLSSRLVKLLTSTSVKILDHEFKDWPRNLDLFSKDLLLSSGKLLALGSISTKSSKVETVEEVKSFILKAREKFGEALFIAKPDCGFRGLRGAFKTAEEAYAASLDKLKVLVEATKSLD